ncbi:MAG: hypothetical protein VX519_01745 [Myxococcota bacterium]|nr:hypothetical protein [Myxococcota bacterium]
MHRRGVATWLVGFGCLASSVAYGGEVFLNGLVVEGVKDVAFPEASVSIDAHGDVHIFAPSHKVEAPSEGVQAQRAPKGQGLEYGRWWLVGEDTKSSGHRAEVWISGVRVAEVRSSGPAVMLDLGPFLSVGDNVITVRGGSEVTASGTLAIYVGEARVEAGTLNLNEPSISIFCRTTCPDLKQETLRVH